jgi:hypothetical protein
MGFNGGVAALDYEEEVEHVNEFCFGAAEE